MTAKLLKIDEFLNLAVLWAMLFVFIFAYIKTKRIELLLLFFTASISILNQYGCLSIFIKAVGGEDRLISIIVFLNTLAVCAACLKIIKRS